MKLTAAQLKRLLELMSKAAAELNDAEKAELTNLKAIAAAAKDGDGDTLDAEGVKALVIEAMKTFNATAEKPITAEQVKTIVEGATKGLAAGADSKTITDAVLAEVKKILPASGPTADDVKKIVTDALKNHRSDPKMLFGGDAGNPDIEFPIAHRSGNLSVDQKQLLNVMTGKAMDADIPETVLKDAERRGERAEKRLFSRIGQKTLITTSGSGTGAEFMNTTLSTTLLERMYLESLLAAALTGSEVMMPTSPFNFPLSTTRPTFRLATQGSAPAGSNGGTAGLALDAKKLTGIVDYSYEADEDAIIAILPWTLKQLGESAAAALEDAIINGDIAATHQDSDSHALGATHSGKMFDGLRKLALAQSALKASLATGGISTSNVGALKKMLGRWGLKPKDLLIVCGVAGYNDIVLLPETLTAEKIGNPALARINTGMAPNLLGIDIVPSASMREDLNASGVYDGTTTTKGSIMIVHKPSWIQGVRRGFTVETDSDKKAQTRSVIASFRRDFKPIESLANTRAAVLGYNFNSGA